MRRKSIVLLKVSWQCAQAIRTEGAWYDPWQCLTVSNTWGSGSQAKTNWIPSPTLTLTLSLSLTAVPLSCPIGWQWERRNTGERNWQWGWKVPVSLLFLALGLSSLPSSLLHHPNLCEVTAPCFRHPHWSCVCPVSQTFPSELRFQLLSM